MYRYQFSPKARQRVKKLAKRNPRLVEAVMRKIKWLAEHADDIAHQPIKGSKFFSLHSGALRIPYLLDKSKNLIIILDIAQHDSAYDRIKRLQG
jgi:mRNA-degrading endonuclease RelE of RelBE toxin-antitoxin system